MEVDRNHFPKLVDVDTITVNWALNNRESNVETRRDMTLANMVTSTRKQSTAPGLPSKTPMPEEVLGMARNRKAKIDFSEVMT